jgi:hypothetical protein
VYTKQDRALSICAAHALLLSLRLGEQLNSSWSIGAMFLLAAYKN